jgi:PHD/YefM family antitoxin component YafN of YafNO toxin-antitoxin module
MAFGFSAVLVLGLVWTGVVWNRNAAVPEAPLVIVEDGSEDMSLASLDAVARTDVFEDLLQLNAGEAESLQMILDETTQGVSQQ